MNKKKILNAERVISTSFMFEYTIDKEKVREKVILFNRAFEFDQDSQNALVLMLFQRYGLFEQVKKEHLHDILQLSAEKRQSLIDESIEE